MITATEIAAENRDATRMAALDPNERKLRIECFYEAIAEVWENKTWPPLEDLLERAKAIRANHTTP